MLNIVPLTELEWDIWLWRNLASSLKAPGRSTPWVSITQGRTLHRCVAERPLSNVLLIEMEWDVWLWRNLVSSLKASGKVQVHMAELLHEYPSCIDVTYTVGKLERR